MVSTETMKRAVEIVEAVTEEQVEVVRQRLAEQGVSREKCSCVDRAMVAAAHLRCCLDPKGEEHVEGVCRRLKAALRVQ